MGRYLLGVLLSFAEALFLFGKAKVRFRLNGDIKMSEKTSLLNSSSDEVWCPRCNEYARFIKISKAAELADVSRRTIYRYIEEGGIYSFKIAGRTQRVCSSCLLKPD